MSEQNGKWSLFPYDANKVLPPIFAALVCVSGSCHLYQSFFKSKWYRFGGFMVWGSSVWLAGFICREVSAYRFESVGIFIAQYVLVLAGPPIFAAAEYFILGRLLYYIPYHSPLHPGRTLSTFLLLSTAVEVLSANGASRMANTSLESHTRQIGAHLLQASLLLQACVEVIFFSSVAIIHTRARKGGQAQRNITTVCRMLYTTSSLILIRCVFRAVEAFQAYSCDFYYCGYINYHEWTLWVFEVALIVVYIYVLNFFHPSRLLPVNPRQYLDPDGLTERIGPGWDDKRNVFMTIVDPFGIGLVSKRNSNRVRFWEQDNPVAENSMVERFVATAQTTRGVASTDEIKV